MATKKSTNDIVYKKKKSAPGDIKKRIINGRSLL